MRRERGRHSCHGARACTDEDTLRCGRSHVVHSVIGSITASASASAAQHNHDVADIGSRVKHKLILPAADESPSAASLSMGGGRGQVRGNTCVNLRSCLESHTSCIAWVMCESGRDAGVIAMRYIQDI
jgi:hypothetical protein